MGMQVKIEGVGEVYLTDEEIQKHIETAYQYMAGTLGRELTPEEDVIYTLVALMP